MIVIFDTNVWKSELYLQSRAAAALRFFLRQRKMRVGLPEVVKLEVEHHLRRDIQSKIDRLRSDHRQLLGLFGQLRELVLPTNDQIEAFVVGVFGTLGVELVEIQFTLESARSSFLKTIQKVPPSDTTQEFKDGVLWADCVGLLGSDDVTLVTNDLAFYAGRKLEKGLAPELNAEVENQPHVMHVIPKITDLLEQVRVPYDIPAEEISEKLLEKARIRLGEQLSANGFSLGELAVAEKKLFATEDPRIVFAEFEVRYRCPDLTVARDPATLIIQGDGSYDAESREFRDVRTLSEALLLREQDGTEREVRNSFFYPEGITLGHRDVRSTIRHPLKE